MKAFLELTNESNRCRHFFTIYIILNIQAKTWNASKMKNGIKVETAKPFVLRNATSAKKTE